MSFRRDQTTEASSATDNDELFARALAQEEQERADAELARRIMEGNRLLELSSGSHSSSSSARQPNTPQAREEQERADAELARRMAEGASFSASSGMRRPPVVVQGRPVPPRGMTGRQQQQQQQQDGVASLFSPSPHMCIAPCVIGTNDQGSSSRSGDGICVEMMVDTGAQTSVISLVLARRVGLEDRIDRSMQGVASGVGRARIIGKIRNVICELGHVEFPMDFLVLEVPEQLLLLGLDLMRLYKCIVDLERDVLIFGGKGGVEVAMLPPDEQHITLRKQLGDCPLM